MKTLHTINTIELSNICNLNCKYCIQGKLRKAPERTLGFMSDEIFDRTLDIVKELISRGSQKEINLNGNGESTLDPKLLDRISAVKDVLGDRQLSFCTNCLNMTDELAKGIKEAGITAMSVSPHSPYHARRAVRMLAKVGINVTVNYGSVVDSHNWAGQLDEEHTVDCFIQSKCDPLIDGRGYVGVEGYITPCCYDYRNLGVFGHVFDDDILEREVSPYALCDTCHQAIPKEILKEYHAMRTDNKLALLKKVGGAIDSICDVSKLEKV